MPREATRELPPISLSDVSRGVLSGVSERGIRNPNWRAHVDNLYGGTLRAMRIRPGSRDISTATLATAPHSLMAFYSSGGNKLFVAAGSNIYEAQSAAYPIQTLPAGYLASSDILSHTNLNGTLISVQRNSALTPLSYDGAWKALKLPKPTVAITFNADSGGGSVDVGDHYYRIRFRYANGSSLAGPVSAVHTIAGANKTVNFNLGFADPSPARSDYVGWTLERTKVNGTAAGPFWFVKDGTGASPSDTAADASLGYMVDEGLHGDPPAVDGVVSFAGLLWGWRGSGLYFSRDIGDLEGTGIANFDADDLFQVSKDDGDSIQVCFVVIDELVILKKHSVHVVSGVDRDSFTLTTIVAADPERGSEAGCAGPRAACSIGGKGYFWGESGGMFVYQRGSVVPYGWVEAGRYFGDANPAALDNLLLINHQGNYLAAWYPKGANTIPEDQVIYDARLKQFWHWKGWSARDAIELKAGLFSSAAMVICDPIAIAGVFHLWAVFDGVRDKRASDNTGGTPVPVVEETPWLDFGFPDEWKDLDRVAISSDGDQPTVVVSVATNPPGGDTAVVLAPQSGIGKDWAADAGSNPNDLEWDQGDWASSSPTGSNSGVEGGTLGKSFKLTLSSTPDGDYRPTGIELVAVLLPDKEY